MTAERVVAFDLDETLGHFAAISTEWNAAVVRKEEFAAFCAFMDARRHCYCDEMLQTLVFLVKARAAGLVSRIVVYTNNNGDPSWANAIAGHIGYCLGTRVFDAVIAGYKPALGRNQCRSTHQKTYHDLCRCLGVQYGTEVCFVDDQEHPKMRVSPVTYVKVTPYLAKGEEQPGIANAARNIFKFCNAKTHSRRWTRRRHSPGDRSCWRTRRVGRTSQARHLP